MLASPPPCPAPLDAVLLQYCVFALLYMSQPKNCISNVQSFLHALWFSVQTSATIGGCGCGVGLGVRGVGACEGGGQAGVGRPPY